MPQNKAPARAASMKFSQDSQLNPKTRVGIVPKRREMSKRNSAELIAGLHTGFTAFPQADLPAQSYRGAANQSVQTEERRISSTPRRKIIGRGKVPNGFAKLRTGKAAAVVLN